VRIVIEMTFLGTGTSTGVPVIGCDCAVCTSADLRDQRLRTSVMLRVNGKTILIDTSPDLRVQMLRAKPDRIDGILYTHAHADHTAGLDELRRFNVMQKQRLPVWATESTSSDLQRRFAYAFDHAFSFFGGKPDLDLFTFDVAEPFAAAGLKFQPIPVLHGSLPIVGFRIGNLAYITDVKTIPEASVPLLEGLDVLVLTALRHEEHVAHMNLPQALAMVERLQPRHTWLTHVAHDLGLYATVAPTLPPHVTLATDGMVVHATQ
jgi:phosphoribosyl 1,2-cyclic phosphate phosphodiesterase